MLFHKHTPKLLPFLIKLTRSETQAKEMIQETFLQLWMNREKLAAVENPPGWIYTIASNLSINWLNKTSNQRRILAGLPVPRQADDMNQDLDSRELDGIIQKAVSLLPERRQRMYRLSREADLSHKEIAEQLGVSVNTVKSTIGEALRFIHQYISEQTGLSMITVIILLRL